jgi:hypothetical protein
VSRRAARMNLRFCKLELRRDDRASLALTSSHFLKGEIRATPMRKSMYACILHNLTDKHVEKPTFVNKSGAGTVQRRRARCIHPSTDTTRPFLPMRGVDSGCFLSSQRFQRVVFTADAENQSRA